MSYVGRFAPSPTGPLHFGSLVAALASWLEARAWDGRWLVRIEDVDRLRASSEACAAILRSLDRFGLMPDGPVSFQSRRDEIYRGRLAELQARGLVYRCDCSRTALKMRGAASYDGYCRERHLSPGPGQALRLAMGPVAPDFVDAIVGPVSVEPAIAGEDPILVRKEGFWSYQFAVVVDDIDQGITEVVRGADLVEATPGQIAMFRLLGHQPPAYAHVPLALGRDGRKLSKQTFARALRDGDGEELIRALDFLGQSPPVIELRNAPVADILAWARAHWRRSAVPKRAAPAPGLDADGVAPV